MIRIVIIFIFLFLPLFINNSFSKELNILNEDKKIENKIHEIKYYEMQCANGSQPDKNYDIIYNYREKAIPSLLKQIITDDIYSKVGPNGYIFVSACLLRRITDDITPLNWDKINQTHLDQGMIPTSQKYDYFNAIIYELKNKKILDCSLNNNMNVECKKM